MDNNAPQHQNALVHETSPYLLQHAHNPVDWLPWGEKAFALAKEQHKPVLVSIGYSACHWCHVMEEQSFENQNIAEVMNRHLVCVKVDREERPDVDQYYMEAIQAMGLNGGWPLNVFVLPDKRAFYGGTYFPPMQWAKLVEQVGKAFANNYEDLVASAEKFKEHLAQSDLKRFGLEAKETAFPWKTLELATEGLAQKFDGVHGGIDKAPKFPMPALWDFLCYFLAADQEAKVDRHLHLTLKQMAEGGIYDQIGGGFARYSVDAEWFAPHFEKMLYDNGQLLSLYSHAHLLKPNPLYERVVGETVDWLKREMTHEQGGFFSALDADSEGEEGKFYVWTKAELDEALGQEAFYRQFCQHYNIRPEGNWENGQNILDVQVPVQDLAPTEDEAATIAKAFADYKAKLFAIREKRPRPGLDDKILCSWNALMLIGLCDAFAAFGEQAYLKLALRNAAFIEQEMFREGKLMHTWKNGEARIPGYLEDYALLVQAYLRLYEVTQDETWLQKALALAETVQESFLDPEDGLYFVASTEQSDLPSRKKELFDNVVPSPNSVMAKNFHKLGSLLFREDLVQRSAQMVSRVEHLLPRDVEYLGNWAQAYALHAQPTSEVVVMGPNAKPMATALQGSAFLPFAVFLGSEHESDLELMRNRLPKDGKTLCYVCQQGACQLPVEEVEKAKALLTGRELS